jgi:ribokinase
LGAATILNPAPAASLDPALLAVSDWLIPNETELGLIAGERIDLDDDAALLRYAGSIAPRLLVTLGERGAAVLRASRVDRVPADRVTPVDTTGAGDAFVGAFAFGLAAGLGDVVAVRLGIASASDSVTRHGTQSSYASPDQARELLGRIAGG